MNPMPALTPQLKQLRLSGILDSLDARNLTLFRDEPRVGVLEASRRLGVARGTVQARLDRLAARLLPEGL